MSTVVIKTTCLAAISWMEEPPIPAGLQASDESAEEQAGQTASGRQAGVKEQCPKGEQEQQMELRAHADRHCGSCFKAEGQ